MPLNPPSAFRNWRRYCHQNSVTIVLARLIAPGNRLVGFGLICGVWSMGCGTWGGLYQAFWEFKVLVGTSHIDLILGEIFCFREICFLEVGPAKVGPLEVGPREVGPPEAGPRDVGPATVGPLDGGPPDA